SKPPSSWHTQLPASPVQVPAKPAKVEVDDAHAIVHAPTRVAVNEYSACTTRRALTPSKPAQPCTQPAPLERFAVPSGTVQNGLLSPSSFCTSPSGMQSEV